MRSGRSVAVELSTGAKGQNYEQIPRSHITERQSRKKIGNVSYEIRIGSMKCEMRNEKCEITNAKEATKSKTTRMGNEERRLGAGDKPRCVYAKASTVSPYQPRHTMDIKY